MKNRSTIKLIVFFALLSFLASGCSGRTYTKSRAQLLDKNELSGARSIEQDRALFESQDADNTARLRDVVNRRLQAQGMAPEYRTGVNDEIEAHVFDVPELNFTAKVTEAGFLNVPLIGAVKVSGLTQQQLTDLIHEKLTEYVKDPRLSIAIVGFGSQRVAVLGAVKNPGMYPLKKGTSSLLEVVSEAGGVSPKAGSYLQIIPAEASGMGAGGDPYERARLGLVSATADLLIPARSTVDTSPMVVEVYVDQVLGTSGKLPLEVPLRGGDVVVVPESGTVVVEGEVQRVGSFELGQQMTLLGALAASGGINYGADLHEVEIVRDFGKQGKGSLILDLEQVALGAQANPKLRQGDIIRVPTDTERRISQDAFEGITRILNFGVGGQLNLGR